MSAVLSGDTGSKPAAAAAAVKAPAAMVAAVPRAQVDLAHVVGDRLLVHGWIFGLARQVAAAEIQFGAQVHNLLELAVRVPRPDVTRHFAAIAPASGGDDHGFHLTLPITDAAGQHDSLRLIVSLHSGEVAASSWMVGHGEAPLIAFFKQNQPTLKWLLAHLQPKDTESLHTVVLPALAKHLAAGPGGSGALPCQFGVDLCCLLESRLLVILGWCIGLDEKSTAVEVSVGSSIWDFRARRVYMARPDVELAAAARPGHDSQRALGFIFLAEVGCGATAESVDFDFFTGTGCSRARCAILRDPLEARTELVTMVGKLEGDAAIESVERLCGLLGRTPEERWLCDLLRAEHRAAVERLPISLDCANPRHCLHLDVAIPVANEGIYLNGWFGAEADAHRGIACHSGFSSVVIDNNWVRHPRADVTSHLAGMGVCAVGNDHGYACYVPLKANQSPYFISVTASDGAVRRIRVPIAPAPAGPLQTVRAVLKTFDIEHRALLTLLERQVGPAVQAAWAQRSKTSSPIAVQHFGAQPSNPQISVIVPLYGRRDFAEYQLALFADDAQFQEIELLYFVDDPEIYDEFRLQCGDLQELYGVPFTLLFAGANLGFAGANNRAAEVARGRRLLLLNSDVFPKRPGWAGAMLKAYSTLQSPGLLGAKLLFEDGSVQHAGMAFRRHPSWGDLWINYHPHKGQSPAGLSGIRAADAVTAACVMVDSGLYRELGGLSEDYIVGDFEDSDLCLRAIQAGRRNHVALDIELYHLERQSQDLIGDTRWRTKLTVYNCWQHARRWNALIERCVS